MGGRWRWGGGGSGGPRGTQGRLYPPSSGGPGRGGDPTTRQPHSRRVLSGPQALRSARPALTHPPAAADSENKTSPTAGLPNRRDSEGDRGTRGAPSFGPAAKQIAIVRVSLGLGLGRPGAHSAHSGGWRGGVSAVSNQVPAG